MWRLGAVGLLPGLPRGEPSMLVRDPVVQATVTGSGARTVELSGAWDIRALESRARALQRTLQDEARGGEAHWDLSQVDRLDHLGALLVWRGSGERGPRGH